MALQRGQQERKESRCWWWQQETRGTRVAEAGGRSSFGPVGLILPSAGPLPARKASCSWWISSPVASSVPGHVSPCECVRGRCGRESPASGASRLNPSISSSSPSSWHHSLVATPFCPSPFDVGMRLAPRGAVDHDPPISPRKPRWQLSFSAGGPATGLMDEDRLA